MTNTDELQNMIGRTAVDQDGSKIGKIGQIYLDDRTGQPQWVTVSTGLFGNKESFAPIYGSRWDGDDLVLAVSKDLVKDAPKLDADGHLEDDENQALYSHYAGKLGSADSGVQSDAQTVESEHHVHTEDDGHVHTEGDGHVHTEGNGHVEGAVGHDVSGETTDNAMTRSEERLHVGTEKVEAGRARLRKYIVTENVTTTVPVTHEEVRIEREPITDANRDQAMAGGDITEEEHEVTLHAEQPVVSKETVPVERVRMATETVTEDHTVSEEVRKEQIDQVETDGRTTAPTNR